MPPRVSLHHHVPQSGSLDRTGQNRELRRIGGELAEEGVLGPTAHDVDRLDPLPGYLPGLLHDPAVPHRKALEDTPRDLPRLLRRLLPGRLAEVPDARGHVSRRQKLVMVRVHERPKRRRILREPSQFFVRVILAFPGPDPLALLQKPEPHDVLQKACPAPEASLVGEVGIHRFWGYHGLRGLYP